jgi:phosphate transport system protein
MELGGLVESQIRQAISRCRSSAPRPPSACIAIENRVNQMEVEIDHELSPSSRGASPARDLRLLMAFSKATANLERMGDGRPHGAHGRSIIESGAARALPAAIARGGRDGLRPLRKALDAFAPGHQAGAGHPQGRRPDRPEFDGFVRKLITYMMEDRAPSRPAWTCCSWPRPSSASATIQEHGRAHHLPGQGQGRAPSSTLESIGGVVQ